VPAPAQPCHNYSVDLISTLSVSPSRDDLFCTSSPAFGRVLNCFLAGNNARGDLAATSTGGQMVKDRFAPARREQAAYECGNIFVANMPGFFLTSAFVRHACIPIWPADLMNASLYLNDKASQVSYRAMPLSEYPYSQASCDRICRSQASLLA
jgi:hypothetical protein